MPGLSPYAPARSISLGPNRPGSPPARPLPRRHQVTCPTSLRYAVLVSLCPHWTVSNGVFGLIEEAVSGQPGADLQGADGILGFGHNAVRYNVFINVIPWAITWQVLGLPPECLSSKDSLPSSTPLLEPHSAPVNAPYAV
eukprot:331285-Rhodomonas_salina.1